MINEDRLNTYGDAFDSDTHTIYVKTNGEVKDYKLTKKQYEDLCMYTFNELTPEISTERLSDICEKLAADPDMKTQMAWTGLSYDSDENKGQVTINIDLGDKISSHTISKEDFHKIENTLEWDPGEKPLLPFEELDDKLGKFTAGEIGIDSINVEPDFSMKANHIVNAEALAVVANGQEFALDSSGHLMDSEVFYYRYDDQIMTEADFYDSGWDDDEPLTGWDETTDPMQNGEAVETSVVEEIDDAVAAGHVVVIDENLDLGNLSCADRVACAIVELDSKGIDVKSSSLLEEAKECVSKKDALDKYSSNGKSDVYDVFMNKMKHYSEVLGDSAAAERQTVLEMVSSNKFFIDDIKEAVRENSPLSIGKYGNTRVDFRVDNAVERVNVVRRSRNIKIAEFDLNRLPEKMNDDTLFMAAKKTGMEQGLGNVASERYAVNVMFDNKIPEFNIYLAVCANSSAMPFDKDGIKKMVGEVREERESLAAKQAKAKEQLEKAKERQEEKNKAKQNQRQKQNEGLSGSGGNRKGENSGFSGGR